MNAVIENIKNRRSVRIYKPDALKTEHLSAILEAATWAPSGHNGQSWHFTVIRNKGLIDLISEKTKQWLAAQPADWIFTAFGKNPNFHIFYHAPAVVIVSGKKDAVSPVVDCCAAIENMVLAAESLDIGSCWIGLPYFLFNDKTASKEVIAKLNLPQGYEPNYCVTLGYKDGPKPKPQPRKDGIINFID